jgi:hypothetical protein
VGTNQGRMRMLTEDELSELESDPDSPGRLWGALVGAMEEHEDGPEKLLALILDARDSLIKVDEVTLALCGKTFLSSSSSPTRESSSWDRATTESAPMGRPLVESYLSIDVTDLHRLLDVRPSGVLRGSGVDLVVSYRLEPSGSVLLSYPGGHQQRLRILSFPMHNGGVRYYFDVGARRCKKLFLPHGGDTFRSRQAYGLRYRSQALNRTKKSKNQNPSNAARKFSQ